MILSNDTQRPSSVELWQMPQPAADPRPFPGLLRDVPLDAHDTSYFASSASICSLSKILEFINAKLIKRAGIIYYYEEEHRIVVNKFFISLFS